ncbi:MAG: bifunctional UDP-N-acetylmuramoyl-tripeptide:D-alanyl-D-alanine ligase/alanine racemase [Candidatus Nephrothrix sp. EaCA]|nr:MAG: bifunctional UDP-N-acetylmuramoyl-tripeptide:D-alanyl-D-alanine ligase/alanine racemase [Candidatus Nephrothrix sp. EaCA]
MQLLFSNLASIAGGKIIQQHGDEEIQHLVADSRKAIALKGALFIAIRGLAHNGHKYIGTLYEKGFRLFMTEEKIDAASFPEASFVRVENAIRAAQQIAKYHRRQFHYPVVGITGSNGKTVIKEWLYQLLSPDWRVVKNPGSYNSQLGVPLSVWQMQDVHQLAIFEAGISQPGEMENLAQVIAPTIGILTNLGTAHAEGFQNEKEKLNEKLKLFSGAEALIYCRDQELIQQEVSEKKIPSFSWGFFGKPDVLFVREENKITGRYNNERIELFPVRDQAFVENLCHCVALMLYLKIPSAQIHERIQQLKAVPMRLELKDGINHSQLIDDTYNNDLGGLKISLDFLARQQRKHKAIILSDILQTGLKDEELSERLTDLLKPLHVEQFVGIGSFFMANQKAFEKICDALACFPTTDDFLENLESDSFREKLILVKGARAFQFEKIIHRLQQSAHRTVMEVDLHKLTVNLNLFRSRLRENVKLMVMVKALAYGSGTEEVAALLQYNKVDYLGVAYTDEGVELRKQMIRMPIMIMNTTPGSFELLFTHQLEPGIFSLRMLQQLIDYAKGREVNAHVELETGMLRLGFPSEDLDELILLLKNNPNIKVVSVFTHLAGADESIHDEFSKRQAEIFLTGYKKISEALSITPMRHVLNSAGIIRMPKYQFDMVRLGIGFYGVNPTKVNLPLEPANTLKTVISQIKKVKKGESIGYGRHGQVNRDSAIATIAIGYADGFSRAFGRGRGCVLINGKRAPVAGNVCMDMTMVDVTDIACAEGDEVIIFGKELPIQEVAAMINTIPYEMLTNTSARVKRVFYTESA